MLQYNTIPFKLFRIARITICCSVILFIGSCESHEQKSDDAFEKVKNQKMKQSDSAVIMKEEPVTKVENLDEWTKFKIEIGKKISSNESKIRELKSNPKSSAKLVRKAANLEEDNNALRRQMDEYNEEMKVQWENFKVLMNHNVNIISIELKDLSINNRNIK